MNRDEVTRRDFPEAPSGYDRPSVDAHLDAVAATVAALEAQIEAGRVERDALRRNASAEPAAPSRLPTPIAAVPDLEPVEEPAPVGEAAPVEEPAPVGEAAPDESSARLVAMKMALDGAEREAIRTKLEGDYSLGDVEALLDDVFKRVG